ncbi:unnamed protein product [Closterium sp. NIES-65]|nr:unnamed protein product [Closterium sp. NIES-65]
MAEEEEDTPEIFIDRDPKTFGVLLNFLRSGVLNIPSGVTVDAVLSDADYLGLLDAVKAARLPPGLDANEMHKVSGLELPCNAGGRNTGSACDVGIVGVPVKAALLPPALDANEMHKTSVLRPNVGPADVCTALAAHEDGSVDVAHGARVDTICRLSESRIIVGGGKGCYHLPIYDTRGYNNTLNTLSTYDNDNFTSAFPSSYASSHNAYPSHSPYSSPYFSSLSNSQTTYGSPATLPSLSPSSLSSYTPSPLTLNQPPPSSSISPIILPQSASHYPTPTTNPLYSPPLPPSLLPSSSAFPSPYSPFAPTCKIGSVALRGASHPSFRSIVQSDRFLFVASLRKTLGVEWGVGKAVGVVDRATLQSVGEAGPAPITTRRMGGPDKLQWLSSRNLLMVARRYTPSVQGGSEGPSYLRLWDPRCNQLVWDWREFDDPQPSLVPSDRWCALCDATACEDLSLLLKASPSAPDSSSRLSAFDLRKLPLPGTGNSAGAGVSVPSGAAGGGAAQMGSGLGLGGDDGGAGGFYVGGGGSGSSVGTAAAAATAAGAGGAGGGAGVGLSTTGTPTDSSASSSRGFGNIYRPAAVSGPVPVAGGPVPSIGQDSWTVMQWQSPDSLRIGGTSTQRDSGRVETSTIRLLVVPGRSQIVCNRCPSLEVWTPVSNPFVPVATGRLSRWASLDEEKLGSFLSVGGGQGGIRETGGVLRIGGRGAGGGGRGDDVLGGYPRGALTPGSLSAAAAAAAARGFEPPPVDGTARYTGDEVATAVRVVGGGAGEGATATPAGTAGVDASTSAAAGTGNSSGNSAAAAAAPPPTRFDPYSFRKTYGDTMGEYQRRRVNFEAPPDHWVYDMAFGGNRLFLARDDQRPGGSGLGSLRGLDLIFP